MPLTLTGPDDTNQIERQPLAPLTLSNNGDKDHTDDFAQSQAAKLHLTLGDSSPGVPDLAASFSTGNSKMYRQLLADQDQIQQISTRNSIISSVMQADPKSITPEVVQTIQNLSNSELASPDLSSIVEKKYSQLYTTTAASSLDNDITESALATNREGVHQMLDRGEALAFKRNYAATVYDETVKANNDQSYVGKGFDFLERLVPFVEWYQKHNNIPEAKNYTTSILPGSNLQEQYSYMWSLPPDEFKSSLDNVMDDLKGRNLAVAQTWMEGLFSYGSSDAFFDNALAVGDVASVTPLKTFGKALGAIVKASARNPLKLEEIAADLGKNADAAVGKNIADLKSGDFLGRNIQNSKELENSIPSISAPGKLLEGAGSMPQATYTRLKQALIERADLAKKFLGNVNQIDRATPEELANYKDVLLDDYVKQHPSIQQNVIDVSVNPVTDIGNVYQAEVLMGRRDGTLFESEAQATRWARKYLDAKDFVVKQKGEGFQVAVYKNVDETRFLSDLTLGTTQRTPESLANTFLGPLRSPDYTVSSENVLSRSTAVTSREAAAHIYSEIAKPFRELNKKQIAELEDLMVVNRTQQKYYENYGEFRQAYYDRFKKEPSEKQADTYFAYVQLNDLDLVTRDLDWYKQKARLGLEKVTQTIDGKPTIFEGKVVDNLPYGSKDYWNVSIIKDGKASRPRNGRYLTEKGQAEISKLIEQGYKVIQVSDSALPVGDKYASFVVTNSAKRERVGVLNVERKAGGHKVHKYPYYIKQGMLSGDENSTLYRGDRSLFNVTSEKEGREVLNNLEIARQKLLRHDTDAVQFIRDNLPISPKDFFAAVAKGQIDLKVPFALTKKGVRSIDTGAYSHLNNLVDLGKNEHNLSSRITGSYGGERGDHDLSVIRAENDTQFRMDTAPYLSPMDTLRATASNMMNVRVLNDYSLKTNSDFLREFGDILKGTKEEQVSSGTSLLLSPEFKAGASASRIAAAKNVSRAYNNLMNYGTALDRQVDLYKERLLSNILPKFGPRGQQWVEDRMLPRVINPGSFVRSLAFHSKMGMFNPVQFFKQANSLVNVAAIAGRDGLRGGMAFPLVRGALWTSSEDVLKRLGEIAENTGLMKSDEFVEGVNLFKKSGWNSIGGDTAYLDDIKSPELRRGAISQGVNTFLDWGTTPFKEGERMTRIAGFMAAYLERKAAVKGAKLSRRDEAMILQRAKDLTGNMSRESNATWQKGYGSIFTQFMGYQARITEQMIGKKLSPAEKLRLFVGFSAMYGVPTAVGANLGVLPIRDMLRQHLYDIGEDPDQDWAEPFLDGFISPLVEYMTGTEYNVASSYGTGGIPTFADMFRGDKTFADMLLGAGGGIALSTVGDTYKVARGMASEYADFQGGYYNLTASDFLTPLRNITTVNNAVNLWNVTNFGVWASKNGVDLSQMDLPQGVTAALTGLQPASIEDAFTKTKAVKDYKEYQDAVQKELIADYRKVMKMDDGLTRDKMIRDIKARMILEGFDLKKQAQTWKYAADKEMATDSMFDKYDDLVKRMETAEKARQNNLENQ